MCPPVPSSRRSAFSLVEVALAIAVVSFAVIGIMSLMSTGLGTFRQVMDTTICAQIAQRIINDAEQADYNTLIDSANLPAPDGSGQLYSFRAPQVLKHKLRYFSEQGQEIIPENEDTGALSIRQQVEAVYAVNVRITPRARVPRNDGKDTELTQVTVEIASNPTGLDLRQSFVTETNNPRMNLFAAPAGVKILTYSAFIGRNE